MGYVYLLVALLAGATKGYCGKKTSSYTPRFKDAVFANGIRMVVCVLIGFIILAVSGNLSALAFSPQALLIAALSGVSSAVFVVLWLVSVKKSAYMMVDIFLLMGTFIPLICSNVFFGEAVTLTQWIGLLVLFAAVCLMCSYNNAIKEKLTFSAFALLLLCGAASGVADFSQKLFVKQIEGGNAAAFNLYTYVFAAAVLAIALALLPKAGEPMAQSARKKIFVYIPIMAVCLFLNSFFKTLAAQYLDAVLLYPLNQGAALILSTLMAVALFKEKLTVKAVVGILLAFVGLLIINLL